MANKKFSEFDLKTNSSDVSFVVGFTGSDNVRIAPSNIGASSLNGLSDCLVDTDSLYVGEVPAGLSGNPQDNTILGIRSGDALTSGASNTLIGNNAGDALTTGSNNIIIGKDAAASSATTSNEISLGDTNITAFKIPALEIESASTLRLHLKNHTTNSSASTILKIERGSGSSPDKVVGFFTTTTERGSITVSNFATAYNTSSDYRLKENVEAITDGISRVKQLNPSRFNFIGSSQVVDGFLAHEAQTVVPEAVQGEKDAVDENGNEEYQGIDQGKLVPLLTAALKEAITKIEQLEARVQTLENN